LLIEFITGVAEHLRIAFTITPASDVSIPKTGVGAELVLDPLDQPEKIIELAAHRFPGLEVNDVRPGIVLPSRELAG
jgi:hypothetical protein